MNATRAPQPNDARGSVHVVPGASVITPRPSANHRGISANADRRYRSSARSRGGLIAVARRAVESRPPGRAPLSQVAGPGIEPGPTAYEAADLAACPARSERLAMSSTTVSLRAKVRGHRRLALAGVLLRVAARMMRSFRVDYWIDGNPRSARRTIRPQLSVKVDYRGVTTTPASPSSSASP